MASETEAEAEERDKPIVVRVKRKPSQTRPDAFWLEINERPVKKAMLDFSSLSVSEPSSAPNKDFEIRKVVMYFSYANIVLFSANRNKTSYDQQPDRGMRITSFEEGAILCNFLPLIREHLPSAAEEIESDIISLAQSEDSDVYDIYTVKEVDDDTTMEGTSSAPYPLLQVDNGDDVCYDDDDPYDTDDSNAEDNPLYDYPAELSEDEDDDSNSENPFSDLDGSDPEYEKEEDKEPTMEDLPSNLGQPSTSASSVDASYSANRIEDSQLFLSVPALNQAASYLAQTASYLTQCLPVSGYTAISDEGQELATLPPASTAGGSSFQASSEQSADSSPGEIDNTGSSSQEITEQMAPLRVFQNGASLFQGLVERARKTVRGSADDIGWLQQDQSLPPTEDGTARFLEILDAVRKNEHKLPDSMVYLLVPGLFSNHGPLYFVKTKSYFSKMGLACHIAKIHSESSVSKNAREIKEYIEEIYWGSKKRVLLLGHSKGGVDAAAALSLYWPQLKDKVAGLALAQSPYGGSPVASDILREGQLGDYVRLRKLMEILVSKVLKGDLQALEDLTYERRKEFLRQNPLPPEVPIVSFHTEASITPSVLTALSHVAHLELPAAADGNPTRIPVVMPLSAAMAACSQLLVARYGEKSDGLVTRKDAEVPGSVVVRPERKLDHAWMVYSSLKEEPRDQADTSQVCEALLTLLVEVAQKRRHEMAMKDE
ncbi:hypothetical protein OsI_36901 [Oryza sativa Indica Group]|uniref:Uncharacterized protein n=1 Tax=Oryza sativa subsp. indica TaxID=39946 RepID=B8BLN7_ORYSI|nr:hypothetical protein OsI_36901 [Oryza sativa Indica Group]